MPVLVCVCVGGGVTVHAYSNSSGSYLSAVIIVTQIKCNGYFLT